MGIRPRDPDQRVGASEFSWGSGLVPKGHERSAPAEGGMYRGTTPDMEFTSPPTDDTGRIITGRDY